MPMGPSGFPEMVCNPGLETSRTEGAADINIETGSEVKYTKPADLMLAFMTGGVYQSVGAGLGVHWKKIKCLIRNHTLYPLLINTKFLEAGGHIDYRTRKRKVVLLFFVAGIILHIGV